MIDKLSIQNYKSVKQLDIDCKKINVFIGEPNTGKSNILEALSFFSPDVTVKNTMQDVLRFQALGDLFFDFNYNAPISVITNKLAFELSFDKKANGVFTGTIYDPLKPRLDRFGEGSAKLVELKFEPNGDLSSTGGDFNSFFRTYYFKRIKTFYPSFRNYLSAPFGDNIPGLLLGNPELKKMVSNIFREKGFRLQIKPLENEISISKEIDDELYSYPYYAISETLQRIVFMTLAIESNKNATLVFDEPESNTFPFYTKYIAERMALDETNQFFITTHNPYLLMSIIEKARIEELNIFVARMEKYETKISALNAAQIEKALDLGPDVFFNLDSLAG